MTHYRLAEPAPAAGRLRAWGPAVAWACFIFLMSTGAMAGASTGSLLRMLLDGLGIELSAAAVEMVHFAIRKAAHVTEYFVFALTLDRGFAAARGGDSPLPAFAAAVLYSLADEAHQAMVPSRTGSIVDCGFDTLGAGIGLLLARRFGNPFRMRRRL
ncbi:MAG: VanZ family protein [Candidatus Binatia bacterium]